MSSFLSSSMCLWVSSISCLCSVFMGMLMLTLSFLFLYWWNRRISVVGVIWSSDKSWFSGVTRSLDLSRIWRTCRQIQTGLGKNLLSNHMNKTSNIRRSALDLGHLLIWKLKNPYLYENVHLYFCCLGKLGHCPLVVVVESEQYGHLKQTLTVLSVHRNACWRHGISTIPPLPQQK